MNDTNDVAPVVKKKHKLYLSVRLKAMTAVAVASLVVVLASSITGYALRQKALLEEFQILTQSIASTGAIGISGEGLKHIHSNQDVPGPEFQSTKRRIESIRDANGLRNEEIYILRPLDIKKFETEFVVMPGDKPFVGNVYTIRPENRTAFHKTYKEGKQAGTNIYHDEHGVWISAYAPIFDASGNVEAVLEVDAEISRFLERANQEFLQVLGVGIGAFIIAFIPGIFLVTRLTSGLYVIKKALDQFEATARSPDIQLNTHDELGDVARSFNEMASKLYASQEKLINTNISLHTRTTELNQSLTLTNTIMNTVQESLMLITPEGKIESGYSAAVEKMFGRSHIQQMPLVDLVRDRVTGKTYDLTVRFLKLLFNENKTNHLIPKLNPLKEVEIIVEGQEAQMQFKYLSFTFDRVWKDKKIVQALVTVEDITPRIALTRELKESTERLERQAELLFGVIHVEPSLLKEFINISRNELDTISNQLSQSIDAESGLADRQKYFTDQVESIFRCVHRIKGEAALLKISYYENVAHQFEGKLERLQRKHSLDGNDFVPIVLELSKMVHSFDDMSEVIQKITNMYGNSTSPASQENSAAPAPISQDLENLTYNLSEKHQKKVEFYSTGNALTCVPGRYQRKVRDILIQLIRNSVAHGIEQPQVRTQSGKPEEGRIHLEVREEKNWVRVIYSDDGSGLNYQKIIARAKKLDQEQPGLLQTLIHKNEWNLEKVNDLVFLPGFSTKEEADKDSGRGVGLDVVRKMVNDMKGQISLQTEQGEYCAFIIDLPLTEKAL